MKKEIIGYYGSELNKFIDEYCDRNHTTNNIDCIQYKIFFNDWRNEIRIIEFKHLNEHFGANQLLLLREMAKTLKLANKNLKDNLFNVYIATGACGPLPPATALWIAALITNKEGPRRPG